MVAVASLPKEIAAGLHPKQTNAIRGLLLQSGWVVEKLEDDSCMVTYVVQVNYIDADQFQVEPNSLSLSLSPDGEADVFFHFPLHFSWILQGGCQSSL